MSGRESLWGWFFLSVLIGGAGSACFALGVASDGDDGRTVLVAAGALLAVPGLFMAQVVTLAIGVQMGMARHEYLRTKRR